MRDKVVEMVALFFMPLLSLKFPFSRGSQEGTVPNEKVYSGASVHPKRQKLSFRGWRTSSPLEENHHPLSLPTNWAEIFQIFLTAKFL